MLYKVGLRIAGYAEKVRPTFIDEQLGPIGGGEVSGSVPVRYVVLGDEEARTPVGGRFAEFGLERARADAKMVASQHLGAYSPSADGQHGQWAPGWFLHFAPAGTPVAGNRDHYRYYVLDTQEPSNLALLHRVLPIFKDKSLDRVRWVNQAMSGNEQDAADYRARFMGMLGNWGVPLVPFAGAVTVASSDLHDALLTYLRVAGSVDDPLRLAELRELDSRTYDREGGKAPLADLLGEIPDHTRTWLMR